MNGEGEAGMKRLVFIVLAILAAWQGSAADGVIRPTNISYPKDFLRHRMTKVDVTISGQIAQTVVYQEFVNEWISSTDGVYSFPLPPNARATNFYFWSNDTMYRAVLKVTEQAPNPGTGEGGVDALLTQYLGPNSIRILIHDIPAGGIQRVQLEYITLCSYLQGTVAFNYPLNTSQFTASPVDLVSFTFRVSSNEQILSSTLDGIPGGTSVHPDDLHLKVNTEQSKMYLTDDVAFSYKIKHDSLTIDFYAVSSDTMNGHFVMILNPASGGAGSDVLPKNVVFVLDRSSLLFGVSLEESKSAIVDCLKKLQAADSFSVVTFDYSTSAWSSSLVPATPKMVDSAAAYVVALKGSSGSNLSDALTVSFGMFKTLGNNIILLFSDGKAAIDPKQIRTNNVMKAAILPVSVNTTPGRQRLEMLSFMNYGFPTFFDNTDPVIPEVGLFFDGISYPVWRDVRYEMGSNVNSLLPAALPTLFKGSRLYLTGRFIAPGTSAFSIAGFTASGASFMDKQLLFPTSTNENKFAELFWAKEKIDDLERQVAVYGEKDSLKKELIALSLGYGIRCKYTAYIADKTIVVGGGTGVDMKTEFTFTSSEVSGEKILLKWNLAGGSEVREIRIYRKLKGEGSFTLIVSLPSSAREYQDRTSSAPGAEYILELVKKDGSVVRSQNLTPNPRSLPQTFALEQNYPNPFNPSTKISFSIPSHSLVSLKVFDALGREVFVLLDEELSAGTYSRDWNASNMSSGIYFYKLEANNFSKTRKLMLLK